VKIGDFGFILFGYEIPISFVMKFIQFIVCFIDKWWHELCWDVAFTCECWVWYFIIGFCFGWWVVIRCCFHVCIDAVGCCILCGRFCEIGFIAITTVVPKCHLISCLCRVFVMFFVLEKHLYACLTIVDPKCIWLHYLPDFLHKPQNTIHILCAMF
jgi:hypothetical protein